jgi:hypothetical protein
MSNELKVEKIKDIAFPSLSAADIKNVSFCF